MTNQQLLQFKKKVEDAKTNVAELRGQLQAQMKNLKQEGFATTQEANVNLKSLDSKIETLQERIEKHIEEIENNYGEYL
jgi:ribosome recycling factor